MKPYKGKDVKGYIAFLDEDKRHLVVELRKIVVEAVPDVEETIKWGTLVFQKDQIIGAIMAHKEHVNLQLWRGSELKDPNGMLEGETKGMRHVTILSKTDIKKGPLKALIRQAAALPKRRPSER